MDDHRAQHCKPAAYWARYHSAVPIVGYIHRYTVVYPKVDALLVGQVCASESHECLSHCHLHQADRAFDAVVVAASRSYCHLLVSGVAMPFVDQGLELLLNPTPGILAPRLHVLVGCGYLCPQVAYGHYGLGADPSVCRQR